MSGDTTQKDQTTEMFDAIERAHAEYESLVATATLDYLRQRQSQSATNGDADVVGQSVSASSIRVTTR